MLKAYLDPNIINWVRRADWSAAELRARLEARNLHPHFGIHGIYELARGLLSEENMVMARSNFQILSELDPTFGPTTQMLYSKEVDLLRTGAAVIPILDERNRAAAKYQVREMALGRIDVKGMNSINEREAKFARDRPLYVAHQLSEVRAGIEAGEVRPKTLDEALVLLDAWTPTVIRKALPNRVTISEANTIHAGLDTFPAIRSTVRANLYLWATPWLNNVGASRDKTNDYRHVIEASYSDVFVTGDRQLEKMVPLMHPGLKVLTWDALQNR